VLGIHSLKGLSVGVGETGSYKDDQKKERCRVKKRVSVYRRGGKVGMRRQVPLREK